MKKAQGHDLNAHYSVAEKQLSSSRMPYIGSYENELCMAKIRKGEQTHETTNQEAARVLLTLVMLIGLLPTAALAASEIDKVELTCTRAQIVPFLFRCLGD